MKNLMETRMKTSVLSAWRKLQKRRNLTPASMCIVESVFLVGRSTTMFVLCARSQFKICKFTMLLIPIKFCKILKLRPLKLMMKIKLCSQLSMKTAIFVSCLKLKATMKCLFVTNVNLRWLI